MLLAPRYFKETAGSYFLFGPRGTGKSTWLQQVHSDAGWIDLLDATSYRSYLAYPERLEEFAGIHRKSGVIVIDEIQRVPQLLPMVHKLIEQMPDLRFILTGSSARKLRQAGVDLLGGRAAMKKMHPFMAAELGDAFDLDKALKQGLVPLIWASSEPSERLRGYIGLYLEQEIRAEGLVRKLDNFTRALETLTFSQGNLLSVSAIARECEAKRGTVESYVQLLEDLLIADRIPVFSRRAKRALVAHSKFYFFDCGIYRSLRPAGPIDRPEELASQALEGLVYQHLRAWIDYRGSDARLHFWRTSTGSEVDFILYGSDCFAAIEVKNSAIVRNEDLRPLRAFREDYPESKALFLYRGRETLLREGIVCMPVERFLRNLTPAGELLPVAAKE